MDYLLSVWMSALIRLSERQADTGTFHSCRKGTKLRLLLAGYNGARNTGSDLRVEEIIRQFRAILGNDCLEMTVLTRNVGQSSEYFGGVNQRSWPDLFPPFLYREVPQYDGVIACEGSMFTSTFANALSIMIIGCLGLASARGQISVGYGGEAGAMAAYLERMCKRFCRKSLIYTRTEESFRILSNLGITCIKGTDTAWTFEPLPRSYGQSVLRQAGWDGIQPLLAVCPINPFWWPVRASLLKSVLAWSVGAFHDSQYSGVYFHKAGRDIDNAFAQYIARVAGAISIVQTSRNVFPVVIGMEALDEIACWRLSAKLNRAPVFLSTKYNMYQLVSILRCCRVLVSSRYHAIVTAMPAMIPAIGITIDERIRNLMIATGHANLLLTAPDPNLMERLRALIEYLCDNGTSLGPNLGRNVCAHLRTMALMGQTFAEHLRQRYPDIPIRASSDRWESFLPSLSRELVEIIERYA